MAQAFDIKFYKIVSQFAKVTVAQYIDLEATVADVTGAGFFNSIANQLDKGSLIFACTTTGTIILVVDSVQDGDVVVSKYAGAGTVTKTGTATLTSTIQAGDNGGSIICDIQGDTFKDAATTASNWTITPGTTGLTLGSIVKVDPNTARLVFTGTAAAGTISIQPKAAAVNGGATITAGTYTIA